MKTKRRHELHTNALADWLGRNLASVRPYFGWIALGAASVILAIGLLSYLRGHSEESVTAGSRILEAAGRVAFDATGAKNEVALRKATEELEQLAEEYRDTPLAALAEARLGDVYLVRGRALMNGERAAAQESFRKAAKYFESAATSAKDPLIKNRVLFALGTTYEWVFQLDDARHAYHQVGGTFKAAAEERIKALANTTNQQFYAKLQKYNPKPQPVPSPKSGPPEDAFDKPGDELLKQFGLEQFGKEPGTGDGANSKGPLAPAEKTKPGAGSGGDRAHGDKKSAAGGGKATDEKPAASPPVAPGAAPVEKVNDPKKSTAAEPKSRDAEPAGPVKGAGEKPASPAAP